MNESNNNHTPKEEFVDRLVDDNYNYDEAVQIADYICESY
jgi:hypothetical protein